MKNLNGGPRPPALAIGRAPGQQRPRTAGAPRPRMDFSVPAELRLLKQSIGEWVEQQVMPAENRIEEEDRIPEELLGQAAELGRSSHGFCTVIGAHTGIGTTGIVEMGTEEQRRRYLPEMATGDRLACFALTEPQAGSDASRIRTTAIREGDTYLLNGQKCFITNATEADLFTVFAVTDPEQGARGISAFVVERGFPGFEVGRPEKKMGLRGSHTAGLFFTDCEVPARNLLGQ